MRNIRPALLVMLLCAAGLGVPGAFAQTTAKGPAKKTTSHGSSAAASGNSGRKSSSSKPSAENSATNKSAATPPSHAASSRAAVHGTSKKASSSKRLRRQPGQKAPTSDRVSEIQSALAKDGSFPGEPNGVWDDTTSGAMRKFQASHGLNPTGKLDALTLQKLGLGSETAGVAAPTPPPGSVSRLTSSNSLATSAESARRQ